MLHPKATLMVSFIIQDAKGIQFSFFPFLFRLQLYVVGLNEQACVRSFHSD